MMPEKTIAISPKMPFKPKQVSANKSEISTTTTKPQTSNQPERKGNRLRNTEWVSGRWDLFVLPSDHAWVTRTRMVGCGRHAFRMLPRPLGTKSAEAYGLKACRASSV